MRPSAGPSSEGACPAPLLLQTGPGRPTRHGNLLPASAPSLRRHDDNTLPSRNFRHCALTHGCTLWESYKHTRAGYPSFTINLYAHLSERPQLRHVAVPSHSPLTAFQTASSRVGGMQSKLHARATCTPATRSIVHTRVRCAPAPSRTVDARVTCTALCGSLHDVMWLSLSLL